VKVTKTVKQVLPAALVILSAAVFISAQDPSTKHNPRPQVPAIVQTGSNVRVEPVKYTYEFSQPKFYVKHIVIEHDQSGKGTITFERLNEDVSVVEPLVLSDAALGRITSFWTALQFLDSDANYQTSQSFAHLGVMKIGMQQGERKRVAQFDWTHNENASGLVNEYKKACEQAILVFDMTVSRENQPLNMPKLMEAFESLMNRSLLSDPKQVLPLLKEISTDEHVPLIARNHALRLIKKIEKK
jgi:uncharacterized protein (UPF0147 family)